MRRLVWNGIGAMVSLGLLAVLAVPAQAGECKKTEKKVTIDQVPAAVKETILKEAGENKIKEIEEITKGEVKTYEAEWVVEGKEVEIKVAADGKLLGKKTKAADCDDDDEEGDDH